MLNFPFKFRTSGTAIRDWYSYLGKLINKFMTILAQTTYNSTTAAIATQNAQLLSSEMTLCEGFIGNAVNKGLFYIVYNSILCGNPLNNGSSVISPSVLTPLQQAFYNSLITAGYIVTLDSPSGFWNISWNETGFETLTTVYSLRTTLTPGAIAATTITAINTFFKTQIPVVTSRAQLLDLGAGGVMDETTFGATASTFYEYSIVVSQMNAINYAIALKAYLIAENIGYVTGNCMVYKIG